MPQNHVVFLLDVDNTLLDNNRVTADPMRHLKNEVGHEVALEGQALQSNIS